jgi:uroporphyrinogen-III synthase
MRILVTRPEPDGERTAAALRARGHEVITMPLLRIEAIADADLGRGPWAAVVLTSANAARAIASHRRFGELVGLPAYVVGARTKAAAQAAGFAALRSADGDLDDLVGLVAANPPAPGRPLLYLAGAERAGDLAGAMRRHGIAVETAVVYRSVMVTTPDPALRMALANGEVDAVLHYSARSASAYLAAATAGGIDVLVTKPKHFCLSSEVAAPLLTAGATAVEAAAVPTEQALLELVGTAAR